ncbi:MAG: Rne/Rng family ribonuclease [Holosporales bacterium]|jgi:ribonuclease E|nr:Rne/Rng family ribonuclease [Holosporales bacterium]
MASKLLIDAHYDDETRIAIIDDKGKLESFESEHMGRKLIKGNIYLAKIIRIEPSIQAAFIDYGDNKHGFLPFSEIHHDYFNKNIVKSTETENLALEADGKKKHAQNYKIQEVIALNQIVLVQAQKETRGNKCAYFSTYISIPGRYCVLVPNPAGTINKGVSKKISSDEKDRLREIISSLDIPEGMGCIIRTAGENRTKQEIKRDFEYLIRFWNEIRESIASSIAPTLIHEEGNIIKRTIRDLYKRNSDKILVQGQSAYKEARSFMKTFTPSHVKKVELYKNNETNIFQKYGVEEKISEILNPIVTLPSGGTIVINPTEALTAIDVNSGKSKTERAIEDTALKTNSEAAYEIARQLKLRDIAGIIVIDFIDMIERSSVSKVEKAFKDAIKDDSSSLQIGRISQFGLLEISRQRLRPSLSDSTFVACQHCLGSGKVFSDESSALSIIRKIENFLIDNKPKSILVEVASGVDLFILNSKRKLISNMEETYKTGIEIVGNPAFSSHECNFTVKECLLKNFDEEKISENITEEKKYPNKPKKNIKKQVYSKNSKSKNTKSSELQNKTNINKQIPTETSKSETPEVASQPEKQKSGWLKKILGK